MQEKPHISVMLPEVLKYLAPQDGELIMDGTFGAGGYSAAILDSAHCNLIALDRDPSTKAHADALTQRVGERFEWYKTSFSQMGDVLERRGSEKLDGLVLDIGVSSMQVDEAERGFSFRFDGPLDMRMSDEGDTAADLVNELPEEELANVIYRYGEERRSRAIASAIVAKRAVAPITTTMQLRDVIHSVMGASTGNIDSATRTFQALRIAVNEELRELELVLDAAATWLKPHGRLVVVTFHSLEDRIVKRHFKQHNTKIESGSRHLPPVERTHPAWWEELTSKAVKCSKDEAKVNARSRSAKLRAVRRVMP